MKDWLAEVRKGLAADDEFFAEMDRQLGAALTAATAEPTSTFLLLPPEGGRFEIVATPRGETLRADLLNIDIVHAVELAWTRSDGALVFEWVDLPADEIREDLANRRKIAIDPDIQVAVEIRNPVWPFVRLILHSDRDLAALGAEAALHGMVNAWNAHGQGGAIHNARRLERLDDHTFAMNIDFGTAGVDALNHLLRGVAGQLPIERIVLDG